MSLTVKEKVSKAKAKLIMYQPFFATIVCSLPMEEDNSYPTMATNGTWIKYNHDFVDKMTLEETMFVLCHEVGHCMFAHMFRRKGRNPKKWNMAGDYVINDLLINDNIGTMPPGGLHNPQLVQQGGGTTDGVYELLPDEPDDDGSGYNGTSIDICEDAGGDAASQGEAEAEIKVMVAQAAQAAKMAGKLSANLQRLVDDTLRPMVDWKDVLRRFVSARAKVEYSFARPKRRFISEDLYMPSLGGQRMGRVLIAVDCSGSIGQKELNEFAAEMRAIKEDVSPSGIEVFYFDSEVSHHDTFAQDEDLHVEPHGGGGTAFSPIFDKAGELGLELTCCVVLTDLCCYDFGNPPDYPVLWVSNGSDKAPWGEVVMMKDVA